MLVAYILVSRSISGPQSTQTGKNKGKRKHLNLSNNQILMESEDIFKYQRLKGKLGSTIKSETITATCLDDNSIVLGTLRGHIYVFGLNCKLVKSYQAHSGSVTALTIDQHDSTIYR